MKNINPKPPNFLNKKDPHFKHIRNTLDALFHQFNKVKQAEVITNEELWKSGVMDVKTPRGLLNATFFIMGKCFVCEVGRNTRAFVYHN